MKEPFYGAWGPVRPIYITAIVSLSITASGNLGYRVFMFFHGSRRRHTIISNHEQGEMISLILLCDRN
ncbi:hypothetical protein BDW74DRAFT_143051 [Aspergillus multicolor]|uniref:uncharacterized protein n=1 Tax=Aspergillus multicolor TaxID=41759 RepID=UPI003CCDB3B8